MQNEHWNGPKIKKLYSWSWSCQVVLGNFLFSELFNREYFSPAFRIYLYFCQKHTPKSRKFNVLPNFTCGKDSCLVTWRTMHRLNILNILSRLNILNRLNILCELYWLKRLNRLNGPNRLKGLNKLVKMNILNRLKRLELLKTLKSTSLGQIFIVLTVLFEILPCLHLTVLYMLQY